MRGTLTACGVGFLLLATGAGAATQRDVTVRVGDTVDVLGTDVACFAAKQEGQRGIACFKSNADGLVPGTFGAAITEKGQVVVDRVDRSGTPNVIFRRTPQAASRYIRLSVGDIFRLAGTAVVCQILRVTSGVSELYKGTKAACFQADAKGPLPRSYGVAVSDKFAGAFRFDASGNAGPDVFVRKQPR